MVLQGRKPPQWLAEGAPDDDVAVSSRHRFARNIRRMHFPNRMTETARANLELAIADLLTKSGYTHYRMLSKTERDYMVGYRLISPEFRHSMVGCAVLIDPEIRISVMINEEDHLRIQALTPGNSLQAARQSAEQVEAAIGAKFPYAKDDRGFFTASPVHRGAAVRKGVLLHLSALAASGRIKVALGQATSGNVTARGAFGESSRAVGAFYQVSATKAESAELESAVNYLIKREREEREAIDPASLEKAIQATLKVITESRNMNLGNAIRCLSYLRWGACAGVFGSDSAHRKIDAWAGIVEVHGTGSESTAARHRVEFLRERAKELTASQPQANA